MKTTTRQDIHRPAVIEPSDYYFVALGYQKCEGLEDVYAIAENKRRLYEHMERTGATFSRHRHGGNCHICGAHCIYTVMFHHVPTNTLIVTGMDCAEKMDHGDEHAFRTFRDACKAAEHHRAGSLKAKEVLRQSGLIRAWELSELDADPTDEESHMCKACNGGGCETCHSRGYFLNSWETIKSMVSTLVKYGDLSDKQQEYLAKCIATVDNWDEIKAEREARQKAERDAAEDCPDGRTMITGEVLMKRFYDNEYGGSLKMLVRDDRGFKVFGNVPSSLQCFNVECKDGDETWTEQRGVEKGDRVSFTATVSPKPDDTKFGYYKRPSKAACISYVS